MVKCPKISFPVYSFSLCDWQLAVRRVDTGRRLMETLQSFMRERAQLEEMYATGLEKLAKKLVAPSSESRQVLSMSGEPVVCYSEFIGRFNFGSNVVIVVELSLQLQVFNQTLFEGNKTCGIREWIGIT